MAKQVNKFDYANAEKVLQVKNLRVNFTSDSGLVHAVRGVSFDLYKGETLCIVGESGSGKSVTSKTIMGILAANAIIETGQILYEGEDLVRISEEEFHRIRGHKIGMIFQDPLSSLNPITKVGKQITEATLINRNILKKHYMDLIADQLVAVRNNDANVAYEENKSKVEIKRVDGFIKTLKNAKATAEEISEVEREVLEYRTLAKKNVAEEIDSLEYKVDYLSKEKVDDNRYLKEDINKAKSESYIRKIEFLKDYLNNAHDEKSDLEFLLDRKNYLKAYVEFTRKEAKTIKPLLVKALKLKKIDSKKENEEFAKNLKEEKDAKIAELTKQLETVNRNIENQSQFLDLEESARYELIKKDREEKLKKNKNLFRSEKPEEINISKMKKQEEKITKTNNEVFDKYLAERDALEAEIQKVNEDYINSTKITKEEAKRMALEVMKEVGIPLPEKRFKQYPFEFSGGMRQRIVIAIALTANPDILICDEPTTALDVTIQAQILELINKLKAERGLSCIFITHDLGVVANMADRVAVMYAGKIVEYGTAYEVFYNPKHPYTWALLSSIPDLDSKERLDAIPGTPPDMRFPPKGDAFALRSKYALDIDFKYEPPYFKLSDTHYAATWLLHEDAPKVEMPSIVKTRIANSIKQFRDSEVKGASQQLKYVPKESFEYIDQVENKSLNETLIKENPKIYQDVQEKHVVIEKMNEDNLPDENYEPTNELEGVINKEDEIKSIKTRCKYKQEYVDKNIILSVNHLKQYFFFGKGPNRYKLKAVHDVNFQIKEGECFGIVGESGCGKTTTGRSIIRLYHITSGSIYYKGHRIGAGKRWNEKEIKYTNIRYKKKVKELNDLLKKGEIEKEQYNAELLEAREFRNDVIKVQKAKIAQIKHDDRHPDKKLINEIQMIFQDPIDSLDPRMTVEDIIKEGLIITRNVQKQKFKEEYNEKLLALQSRYGEGYENVEGYQHEANELKIELDANLESISARRDHDRVVEVLEKVGLIADYCNRYPHEFSGGQRQRIGIARALIMNPKLLICDEPISALDVSIRAQIINLLNNLKEEMGLTIMFIAHDLSVVKYFCDRIAVMYFGEVVELATSDELFRHPLHPYTKSLLSAIPKPNPLTEKNRIRIPYNPREAHDYSVEKPTFVEIEPNHFILANSVEVERYKKEMAELDRVANGEEVQEKPVKKAKKTKKDPETK